MKRLQSVYVAAGFLLISLISAAAASATSIAIETIEEMTARADVVAHVSVVSAVRLDSSSGPCGIVYRAEVHDVLKGEAAPALEFFPGFGSDLDIVFLIDRKSPRHSDTDFSGRSSR